MVTLRCQCPIRPPQGKTLCWLIPTPKLTRTGSIRDCISPNTYVLKPTGILIVLLKGLWPSRHVSLKGLWPSSLAGECNHSFYFEFSDIFVSFLQLLWLLWSSPTLIDSNHVIALHIFLWALSICIKCFRSFIVFHWCSLVFFDLHWFPLIF